ncbi:hypothetical protein GX51_08261 [Blastomyces parvus]|uniref:Uncharacterized protein n=1 Tax=Blastomyces parvus TaxID=2060905 RepID=A0A2B7WFJ0_9EURO|nr:hypothetical protein GX51_08261 [Blastomyces parvus]
MGHPLVYSLPVGPVAIPSSSSPEFFRTDPACSTFFSAAMNINGSAHSKPSTSFTPPSSSAVATPPAPAPSTATNNPSWKPASPSSSSSVPLTMNPSRKRSRDDYVASSSTSYSIDDDQRDSGFGSTTTSSPAIEEADPAYGEAMVLFNQDGTTNDTPSSDLRSRKSQRLDTSASASAWDDNTMATIQAKLQSTSSSTPPSHSNNYHLHQPKRQPSSSSFSSHPLTPQEPQLDSITLLLGISWQRVSRTDDADVAAALRGWERYIQNHYSAWIAQAEILLRHRGLGAFLVAGRVPASSSSISNTNTNIDANCAGTHFYLFGEDLAEARRVGNDWDSCITNLREVPIRYEDGSVVLRASSAMSASTVAERVVEDKGVLIGCVNGATGGGVGDGAGEAMGMSMDMEVGMSMGMDIDKW